MVWKALKIAMLAFFLVTGFAGPAPAQQRVTDEYLKELKKKVDIQRVTYLRFELAEREAMEEGSMERAIVYKEAKAKALEAYDALNTQLENARMARRERDKRLSTQSPDDR